MKRKINTIQKKSIATYNFLHYKGLTEEYDWTEEFRKLTYVRESEGDFLVSVIDKERKLLPELLHNASEYIYDWWIMFKYVIIGCGSIIILIILIFVFVKLYKCLKACIQLKNRIKNRKNGKNNEKLEEKSKKKEKSKKEKNENIKNNKNDIELQPLNINYVSLLKNQSENRMNDSLDNVDESTKRIIRTLEDRKTKLIKRKI